MSATLAESHQGGSPRPGLIGLSLLLPYVAVGIGWVLVGNAWVAMGLYHLGILALAGPELGGSVRRTLSGGSLRFTLAVALLIPIAALLFLRGLPYLLLPGLEPRPWLAARGLEGTGLLVLGVIYGFVHPLLEEAHFQRLRLFVPRLAHLSFAGYHGVVLASCFRDWAVGITVASLIGVSFLFGKFERGRGGPRLSLVTHLVADLVVAAIALHWGGWL